MLMPSPTGPAPFLLSGYVEMAAMPPDPGLSVLLVRVQGLPARSCGNADVPVPWVAGVSETWNRQIGGPGEPLPSVPHNPERRGLGKGGERGLLLGM